MGINYFTESPGNQGQYSNGSYDGNMMFITSGFISVRNEVKSITRARDCKVGCYLWIPPTEYEEGYWRKFDVRTYNEGLSVRLFDINRNEIGTYITIPAEGGSVDLKNTKYVEAVYFMIQYSVDSTSAPFVNRNIHPVPPTDPPANPDRRNVYYYCLEFPITLVYSYFEWVIGYPHPMYELSDKLEPEYTDPPADAMWRVDLYHNNGRPYNLLLPNIPYLPPWVDVLPDRTEEITDQSSIEYKRYADTGYTNPNLYRFRDGDLPENDKCEVFIRGTNSYRYTEVRDYIDGSQREEIP